jgi:hypothetical protein
MSSRTM